MTPDAAAFRQARDRKTLSGKIRRVQLCAQELARHTAGERGASEYREEDFPRLRAEG